jgi:polyisoprenyl-teichoic acid--peptidoglycan teichoic acid transferase
MSHPLPPVDPALRRPRRAERRRSRRRSWPQRLLLGVLLALVVTSVSAASVLAYGLWRLDQIERVDVRLAPPATPGEPENWLIVGSDSRDGLDATDIDTGAFVGDGAVGSGQRSDTILLVRIDPLTETADLVSFPRDLWLPIAGTDGEQRINTAYAGGPQRVVDTIEARFAIPVHHYVEVDFVGFGRLVDAVGGVPMYFDTALRDTSSGLDVTAGCHVLDGPAALAFVRARHLEFDTGSGWSTDGTGDLGRINRQQVFLRRAVDQVAGLGLTDALTVNRLLDVGVDSVTLDRGLGLSQLRELASRFSAADGDGIRSHALPVSPFRTSGGAAVLGLEDAEAQPVLNIFRGLPPGTLVPGMVDDVTVLNATGEDGTAARVADALTQLGFEVAEVGDAELVGAARTRIRHAPGAAGAADLLARHLTAGAVLVEDQSLTGDAVVLEIGRDLTTIERVAREPDPSAVPAPSPTDPAAGPTTSTTEALGVAPPADVACTG